MIHKNLLSQLEESLSELLYTAEYCVNFKKAKERWPTASYDGCLGYPAAALLFIIVDSIGSYFEGNAQMKITIDDKERTIKKPGPQHFYILNSDYYGQRLSLKDIELLYANYRNTLIHSAALPPLQVLFNNPDMGETFLRINGGPHINLSDFLAISKKAVAKFLAQASGQVEQSKQAKLIEGKLRNVKGK